MSENHEGDGWWMASDGNWYPPELHPSVKGDSTSQAQPAGSVGASEVPAGVASIPSGPPESGRVGPQFPDLFQKALQGHHLADNVSVKYDGDDQRNVPAGTVSGVSKYGAPSASRVEKPACVPSAGPVGDFIGASAAKRSRWRRH
jgi:hypothetical protein